MDWQRLARWTLLGTIVMALWLLAPVAKCSWGAFRDTPIGEVEPHVDDERAPGQTDKDRVVEGTGFFSKLGTSVKWCYRQTPLFGQERWKHDLLVGFGALTFLAWSIGSWERRRKRTFTR